MKNKLLEKLQSARLNIFLRDPFLGYILQNYNIRIDDSVLTACTNGEEIIFGTKFLKSLSLTETIFILMHELLHIVLLHPFRGDNYEQYRFNVACDIIVNDIIQSYRYSNGKLKPLFGYDFQMNSLRYTAEKVYEMLPEGVNQITIDFHGLWTHSSSIMQQNLMKIYRLIKEAKANNLSSPNSAVDRMISHINTLSSSHQWLNTLNKYITQDIFDYSFSKIDNRFSDVLLPKFNESEDSLKNVWFLIDVSGSVDNELLSNLLGEIEHIVSHFKSISCDLSFFSTITTSPVTFYNKNQIIEIANTLKTTYGTNFKQIFSSIPKFYPFDLPKLMIILTDGHDDFSAIIPNVKIPVIWVLSDHSITPPFGKTIYI